MKYFVSIFMILCGFFSLNAENKPCRHVEIAETRLEDVLDKIDEVRESCDKDIYFHISDSPEYCYFFLLGQSHALQEIIRTYVYNSTLIPCDEIFTDKIVKIFQENEHYFVKFNNGQILHDPDCPCDRLGCKIKTIDSK